MNVDSKEVSVDFSPIIHDTCAIPKWMGWPRKRARWPDKNKIATIMSKGINWVARREFHWMVSFAEIEDELVKGVDSKEEVMEEYKRLAPPSSDYSGFRLGAGYKEVVVVVGGETEGVSGEAYRLCHHLGGSRLHIPLRNNVNSLNVISATSVIMFKIQQALLEMEVAQNKIT